MEGHTAKGHEETCLGDDQFTVFIVEIVSQVYTEHVKTYQTVHFNTQLYRLLLSLKKYIYIYFRERNRIYYYCCFKITKHNYLNSPKYSI